MVTPSLPADNWVYFVTYYGVCMRHWFCCSYFLTLYIKYVFIFQPDDVDNVQSSTLRWKTFIWKAVLTIISLFLSMAITLEDKPTPFKMLTKGQGEVYNR